MAQPDSYERPDYIPADWLRYTNGFVFHRPPPAELRADRYLTSANSWQQLICVTLQAQAGDFRHVETLLELALRSTDSHLRDCAVTVFGFCAPSNKLDRLVEVFHHPDSDTRLEAYAAAGLSGCLQVAALLAEQRARVSGYERERVMDHLSTLLEPDSESPELIDSSLPDSAFVATVGRKIQALRERYGTQAAVFHGERLAAENLAAAIGQLCAQEEPELYGGVIAQLFSLLEAMTGEPYIGCLDEDCDPVFPVISHRLNTLRQSGRLVGLQAGQRYFFGHQLP